MLDEPNVSGLILWNGFLVRSDNVPLHRAGLYRAFNIRNGKCYVGISHDVAGRGLAHAQGKSGRKFQNGIKKWGLSSFLFEPLTYSIDGENNEWLPTLEAELIGFYDSVKNGYNIVYASEGVGPYGEDFSAIVREAMADPVIREKHRSALRTTFSDPIAAATQALNFKRDDPDTKERHRAGVIASMTPDERSRRSVILTEAYQRPDVQERHHAAMNDPVIKARHLSALKNPAMQQRRLAGLLEEIARCPRRWITDGIESKRRPLSEAIPEGWRAGRTVRVD